MRFIYSVILILLMFSSGISRAMVCTPSGGCVADDGTALPDESPQETPCGCKRLYHVSAVTSSCLSQPNPNVVTGWSPGCASYTAYYPGDSCSQTTRKYIQKSWSFITDASMVCSPSSPPTCSNGSVDDGEIGIDCGGPCSAPCIEACPPGASIEMRTGPDGATMPYCIGDQSVPAAPGGACPPSSGDVIQYLPNSDGTCSPWVGFPTLTAAGDGDGLVPAVDVPDPSDAWLPTPGTETTVTESPPQVVTNPDGSTTSTQGQTEVTKSPDGTQIATNGSTVTTTNPDGSKTQVDTKDTVRTGSDGTVSRSTTTTTSNYDSSGNLISKTVTNTKGGDGTGVYDPGEDDASNYTPVAAAGVPDGIGDQIGSLLTDFTNNVKASPVFSLGSGLFAGPPSSSSAPGVVLDFGSYGEFSFDISDYDSALNVLGMIFVAMTFFASLKLIMVNKG